VKKTVLIIDIVLLIVASLGAFLLFAEGDVSLYYVVFPAVLILNIVYINRSKEKK